MNSLEQEVSNIIDKIYSKYKEDSPEFFIQSILDRMIMKLSDKYPDKIFYCVNDKVYFEMEKDIQKRKNGLLYCRYEDFCEILKTKFSIKYTDIQTLIKSMVEQHFKQEVGTPVVFSLYAIEEVEQYIKKEIGTPYCF